MGMTITLGDVLQIAATVAAVFLAYAALRERLVKLETRLDPLWSEYTERRSERRREEDRHP